MSVIKYFSSATPNSVGWSLKSLLSYMSGFNILHIIHKVQSFSVHIYKCTHAWVCVYISKHIHICVYLYTYINIYIQIHTGTVLVLLFKNSLTSMRDFIKRRPCSTIVTNTGCHGYHCSLPQSILHGLQGLEITSCTACSPWGKGLIHTPHPNSFF